MAVKLDFELPILVRGRPKGSSAVTNVYCATRYSANIPEVSLGEMPIVFEVQKRMGKVTPIDAPMINARRDAKRAETATPYRMRSFNGAYYRKIAGSLNEAEELGLFRSPFDARLNGRLAEQYPGRSWRRSLAEYGGDISPIQIVEGNAPLARPLADEFEWQLDRESTTILKSKTAWPRPGPRHEDGTAGWHSHRNAVFLGSLEAGIRDIAGEDMDRAETMIQSQIDRLLIADGEIWLRTRPPAYKVQFRPSVYKGPPSQTVISMTTAPESYLGDLYTQHFSLADVSRAEETVADIYGRESDWSEGFTYEICDFRVPYDCLDEALLEYDYQQEEINRVGYTAAVECHAFLERKPEYARKLTQDQLDTIDSAFEATSAVNYLLGHHRDMSEFVPTLAAAWKKLGYKQLLTGGQALSSDAEFAVKHALEYIETAPISIDLKLDAHSPRR
jgi:hypothetical protein|nr:hypothetical protein [Neorhizobium tomejilense]